MSLASVIRSHGRSLIVLAACLAGAAPAVAQTSPDLASRIELRAFSSLSLSDSQFLQGDSKASPVTIAGELRFPATAAPGAKQRLVGFKFLRLADDPLAQLRQLDGPDAPRVTLPNGAGF